VKGVDGKVLGEFLLPTAYFQLMLSWKRYKYSCMILEKYNIAIVSSLVTYFTISKRYRHFNEIT